MAAEVEDGVYIARYLQVEGAAGAEEQDEAEGREEGLVRQGRNP